MENFVMQRVHWDPRLYQTETEKSGHEGDQHEEAEFYGEIFYSAVKVKYQIKYQ